jgi:hypothetical protein
VQVKPTKPGLHSQKPVDKHEPLFRQVNDLPSGILYLQHKFLNILLIKLNQVSQIFLLKPIEQSLVSLKRHLPSCKQLFNPFKLQ